MEEENKRYVSLTKRGFWWYTILSFLLVTLMILTAVLMTHSAAVKKIGSTYAEKLALATQGIEANQVQELSTVQTYHKGEEVFEVSFKKDGDKHVIYIGKENAVIKDKQINPPKEEMHTGENNPDMPMIEDMLPMHK